MTATLLELPKLRVPDAQIPEVNPIDRVRWFKLSPTAKCVETLLQVEYKKRYLLSTALTSKLQLEQLLNEFEQQ